jgi:ribonuclease HI
MGIGLVVIQDGIEKENHSCYAGAGNSNEAEWVAFENALVLAKRIKDKSRAERIVLKSDSRNVINQFNGRSRVVLDDVVKRSILLASQVPDLKIKWIRSEMNVADRHARAGSGCRS